jgi:hypothetical protein
MPARKYNASAYLLESLELTQKIYKLRIFFSVMRSLYVFSLFLILLLPDTSAITSNQCTLIPECNSLVLNATYLTDLAIASQNQSYCDQIYYTYRNVSADYLWIASHYKQQCYYNSFHYVKNEEICKNLGLTNKPCEGETGFIALCYENTITNYKKECYMHLVANVKDVRYCDEINKLNASSYEQLAECYDSVGSSKSIRYSFLGSFTQFLEYVIFFIYLYSPGFLILFVLLTIPVFRVYMRFRKEERSYWRMFLINIALVILGALVLFFLIITVLLFLFGIRM